MKLIYSILVVIAATLAIFAVVVNLFLSYPDSILIFWALLALCFFSAISIVLVSMIAWINYGDTIKWVKGKVKKQ